MRTCLGALLCLLIGCDSIDGPTSDQALGVPRRDASLRDAALVGLDGGGTPLDADRARGDGGTGFLDAAAAIDASSSTAMPDAPRDPGPREAPGLVFRRVDGLSIAGDLSIPGGPTPPATVVIVHGGGFVGGSRSGSAERAWIDHLRSAGVASFSIDYRLVRDFAPGEIPFDGAVGDVACALVWLRSQAPALGLDPDRLFVLGSSAGGFLSNYLGATRGELSVPDGECEDGAAGAVALRGVITFYGPSDWNALYADPLRSEGGAQESAFLGITALPPCAPGSTDAVDICVRASATTHVHGDEPDHFIAHSLDDPTIPVGQSRLLVDRLRSVGVDVTARDVDGLGHGWHARFTNPVVAAVRDEIVAWIRSR